MTAVVAAQVVGGSLATNRDAVTAPFYGSPAIKHDRSLVHSNEHARGRLGFHEFCLVFFAYKNIARPN